MLKESLVKIIVASVFTINGLIFTTIGLLIKAGVLPTDTPKDQSLASIIMLIVGVPVLILGLFVTYLIIKSKLNHSLLEKDGIKKIATVVDYEQTNFSMNGQTIYKLLVATDDGKFYSSEGYGFARLSHKYKINDKVDLLIHPKNDKIYKVLISVD